MSSLSFTAAGVSAASAPAASLGEIINARFPLRFEVPYASVTAALAAAGFDPKMARALCDRSGFIRAAHALAGGRLVRNVEESQDRLTFQFTREFLDTYTTQLLYNREAVVTLHKSNGHVTCDDSVLETLAQGEMARQISVRRLPDIRRLLSRLIEANGDSFAFSDGVRFVPVQYAGFIDRLEQFVKSLGGELRRVVVPAGSTQTLTTVQQVVVDGVGDAIHEYEQQLKEVNEQLAAGTLGSRAVRNAYAKIADAYRLCRDYREYLGTHAVRLEDHVAYMETLLKQAEAKESPSAPQVTLFAS